MQIHIDKDGQQYGPYTLDQVNEYLAQGSLQATDPAWHEGMADWCPLNQIAGVVDASSPAPPAFDPAAFNPNAAAPPAAVQSDVPSPTPDVSPVMAGAVTCPGCQAPVQPEMLFCGACGHDLQAGWQDKMTSFPTDAPQTEGSADSGQLAVSTNGPEKLPATVSAKISGYIMMAVSIGILFLSLWFGGTLYKKYKSWEPPEYDSMAVNRYGFAENKVWYTFSFIAFLGGLGLGYRSLQQILGARLCSECKRYVTKYDATCPGCKAIFDRPT